ncbi:heavy metal translocating P-type ATPase [Halobaculum sp. MBLA0147]|uniref:heavy metal translocating P-type ATPase n=1 Tax=Halobaculum sp. MBLA0147 TaxID=3079934 RepID=UPI0035255E20
MTDCTLCGLETPAEPVTDDEVPGSFCCRGCLEVSRTLDDPAATDPDAARERVGSGSAGERDVGVDADDETAARGPDADDAPPSEEAYLHVEGMHCASCEAFLESRAEAVDGVLAADASYPADAMRLRLASEGDAGEVAGAEGVADAEEVADAEGVADAAEVADVAEAVAGVGYTAEPLDTAESTVEETSSETLGRILVGGFFGMMVMAWYVLFLYPTYFGLPADALLFDLRGEAGGFLLANVWVMTSVVLGYTGAPLVRGAYVAVRTREPNMDLLVTLAAVTAYCYSTLALLVGRVEVYFDVTVVVVVAVTVGTYYEHRVKARAVAALTDLTRERVTTARRRVDGASSERDSDGETETVPVSAVAGGDELVVRPGERVPVDGEIVSGEAGIDESLVTGESLPVRRGPGDRVRGGTLVTDGRLVVAADAAGERTLDRVVSTLWDARGDGGTPQRLADALATLFVPAVVCLGVVAFLVHLAVGSSPTDALLTGLAVLVVSCPCALGLATPLAVAAGTSRLLAEGVVLADDTAVEAAASVDTVAFDKTGTLTTGEMTLDRVETDDVDRETLLAYAAAVEARSSHPVADAVVDAVQGQRATDGTDLDVERVETAAEGDQQSASTATDGGVGPDTRVENFETHPGRGVTGTVAGRRVTVGGASLFPDDAVPDDLRAVYERADADGDLAAYVGWPDDTTDTEASEPARVRGVFVAHDEHRDGWREALATVAGGSSDGESASGDDGDDGRRVVVLTGDSGAAADRVRDCEAVDAVYAGLPPEAKTETVRRLRREGTVAMVGDGSNDAPALAAADLGVAVATGTELAADAADAILLHGDLAAVDRTLSILAGTRRRVRENLTWAFGYNAVAVPAAVLGVVTPLLAAVAMAASSLLVVGNSTRALIDPDGTEADGAETDGTEADGAETDGTEVAGAGTDGTEADGTEADGTEATHEGVSDS